MLLLTFSFILGCCCCFFADSAKIPPSGDQDAPAVFTADPQAIAAARASYVAGGSGKLGEPLKKLVSDANKALKVTPPAVTDRKRQSPSKDKHDFLSIAPYYWLDKKTGKYVGHDGKRNPDSDNDTDDRRFNDVCKAVTALGLGFYITSDEKYATKAGEVVRRFFLDKDTKMNPNLNYGQVIPGTNIGRKSGIIGVRCIVELIDAIQMLEGSKTGWKANDRQGMKDWMSDFLEWLTTSKIALEEKVTTNNHGSFYDRLVASIALYVGKTDLARKTISQVGPNRIAKHIQPDGKQPIELKRTNSFHYSLFNLLALSDLASMGKNVDVDLWSYGKGAKPDQSLLQAGLEYLSPYMDKSKKWPNQQMSPIDDQKRTDLADVLLEDAIHFPKSKVIEKALKIADKEKLIATSRNKLLFTAPSI